MSEMNKKKNSLSMANFKDSQGNLIDPAMLGEKEHVDYVLTVLMKHVIEVLEMAVQNDRVFNRSKYEIMAAFHSSLDELHKIKGND